MQRVSAYVASGVPLDPDTDRRWAKQGFPINNPTRLKTKADEIDNDRIHPIRRAVETATAVETYRWSALSGLCLMFPHAVWKNLRQEHYGFSTVPTALTVIDIGVFKQKKEKDRSRL